MRLFQTAQLQAIKTAIGNKKGSRRKQVRDKAVEEVVQAAGCMTREQIQTLLFDMPTGAVKARQRLTALTKQKTLRRCRSDLTPAYVYYTRERPKHIEHTLLVNWVWVRAVSTRNVQAFITEYKTPVLQADALLVFKTLDMVVPYFIEVQRSVSHNDFDKVEKYTALYEHAWWRDKWWVQRSDDGRPRFPRILTITDGALYKLEERIVKQNKHGLSFTVRTLDDLKEGRW